MATIGMPLANMLSEVIHSKDRYNSSDETLNRQHSNQEESRGHQLWGRTEERECLVSDDGKGLGNDDISLQMP